MMLRWVALAMVLAGSLARADTYVLCAGVERYDDQRISSLRYAVADAKSMAALFRASGVPRDNVVLLTSDSPDLPGRALRSTILSALERILERAGPADRFVFFFAGHGVEEGGERYLMPVDARRSLLSDTALPFGLIERALAGVQAGEMLFLLDTCRNDPNAARADADAALSEGLSRGLRPKVRVSESGRRPLMATLLACDAGQRAWEDVNRGHGVFTACLLDGCRGAAADADGRVTLTKLNAYVQEQVQVWAQRAGKVQRPRLLGPDQGDMVVLIKPVEPLITVTARNEPLAQLIAELADQTGAQIVLGEGIDGGLPVSGRLEGQPLGKALTVLTAAYRLRVRKQEDVYILDRAGESAAVTATLGEPTGDTLVVAAAGEGHYRRIGEALARVKEGGRILVRPGLYRESLVVTKLVTIQADAPEGEVVLSSRDDTALKFECDGAAVGGLTVLQRPALGTEVFPAVNIRKGQVELAGCEIMGGKPGLLVSYAATQVTLRDCTVSGSSGIGIEVSQGAQATLERCRILGNREHGLFITDATATLDECSMVRNSYHGCLSFRSKIVLRRCEAAGNNQTGFAFCDKSVGSVLDCRASGNDRGLHVEWSEVTGRGCDLFRNNWGVCLWGQSGQTVLTDCTIHDNNAYGVLAADRAQVNMTNCTLTENNDRGLTATESATVTARQCKISNNHNVGVHVGMRTTKVVLEGCELLRNRNHPVFLEPGATVEMKDCAVPG